MAFRIDILKLDPFLLALIATVLLATFLPCAGSFAQVMGWVTNAGIVLLFFVVVIISAMRRYRPMPVYA